MVRFIPNTTARLVCSDKGEHDFNHNRIRGALFAYILYMMLAQALMKRQAFCAPNGHFRLLCVDKIIIKD
jgi:hypothetical protein